MRHSDDTFPQISHISTHCTTGLMIKRLVRMKFSHGKSTCSNTEENNKSHILAFEGRIELDGWLTRTNHFAYVHTGSAAETPRPGKKKNKAVGLVSQHRVQNQTSFTRESIRTWHHHFFKPNRIIWNVFQIQYLTLMQLVWFSKEKCIFKCCFLYKKNNIFTFGPYVQSQYRAKFRVLFPM